MLIPDLMRGADSSEVQGDFERVVIPTLKEFCFNCHGEAKKKGDLNLEGLTDKLVFEKDFKIWELVVDMLEDNEMPPEEKPQPSQLQRQQLISIIRGELDLMFRRNADDPGRIVLRRLTSAEYAYTIENLTGLNLGLEKTFFGEAVGGEGFSNVGDVQFVQDSTIERYLDAAKTVASHALISSGSLAFYEDPGRTGQELSAIHRIKNIYREYGFRTGAGEGAEAFGLEAYPKAFYALWRYRYRNEIGAHSLTLGELADQEEISHRFLKHIWFVFNDASLVFPSTEIVKAWRSLPAPGDLAGSDSSSEESIKTACKDIYTLLAGWQTALAATSRNDEEFPVLTEGAFRPTMNHNFRMRINWPVGATMASVEITVIPAESRGDPKPAVVWKQPRVLFRSTLPAVGKGQQPRRRSVRKSLKEIVSDESYMRLKFGQGVGEASIGAEDFMTSGATVLSIEFPVPAESQGAFLTVEVKLDIENGDDCLVRCIVSDGIVEGETAASTGASSALLANPNGPLVETWKSGVSELARMLPQVSQREPTPSDRDPIPAPFDNSYNNPERNEFHYIIKYHRDDAFLSDHILDDSTREKLDEAWTDLLTSFDYHETYFDFIVNKLELDSEGQNVGTISQSWIDGLSEESQALVQRIHNHYRASQHRLGAVQEGHLNDVMQFAKRAWRRPLSEAEESRLKRFYASIREEHELNHADGIRSLLARILVAPAFLYRLESPPEGSGVLPLSNWEIASRLSYFLWSSNPDTELERAAAAGELRNSEQLAAQVRRMLNDPKARHLAIEFFGQWFGFYRFDDYRGIDTGRFAEFDDELKLAMYDEAVSFFEYIVREDRPIGEVLFADYALLNKRLAQHYGIESDSLLANEVVRVEDLRRFKRGGLLQLGAVLAGTSAPLRTSAVKRGDWILRRILGTPVPPPPADAGSIDPDDVLADGLTVRERLEAHRSDATCVNCHSRMDPLGFALEHFDPIGRWRDTYRDGQAIDAAGVLNSGREISGLDGLRDYLKEEQALFHRNFCVKLLGYALGRGGLVSDRRLLDQMTASIQSDNHFSNLVLQIVNSTQFLNQRGRAYSGDKAENAGVALLKDK